MFYCNEDLRRTSRSSSKKKTSPAKYDYVRVAEDQKYVRVVHRAKCIIECLAFITLLAIVSMESERD